MRSQRGIQIRIPRLYSLDDKELQQQQSFRFRDTVAMEHGLKEEKDIILSYDSSKTQVSKHRFHPFRHQYPGQLFEKMLEFLNMSFQT